MRRTVSPAELQRLYADTRSLKRVSEMTGLSITTVHRRLRTWGVPTPWRRPDDAGRERLPGDVLRDTAFMYVQLQMSSTEIAEALGLAPDTVRWRLRKAGVPMRDRGEAIRIRLERKPRPRRASGFAPWPDEAPRWSDTEQAA